MSESYWHADDAAVVEEICRVFPNDARPARFTVADGDFECMDHDAFWHAHTPENLPTGALRNAGYSPLSELLLEGWHYFFSTFVRIALREPFDEWDDWPGMLLLWNMTGKEFPQSRDEGQRSAVLRFLHHLMVTRR